MNTSYKISCCAGIGIILILFLFVSSLKRESKNGFFREMIFEKPVKTNEINVNYDSYYIAGLFKGKLMLGNYVAPMHIIQVDTSNLDTIHLKLPVSYSTKVNWGAIRLQFDSLHIFLAERRTPSIIISTYPKYQEDQHKLGNLKFDLVMMISPKSIVVRYFDFEARQKKLQKIVLDQTITKGISFIPGNLNKNSFSNDGFLIYDKRTARLFYTCYYRNEFLCLDTNLNLIYRAKTIDTVKNGNITTASIKIRNGVENMIAAPPLIVNKRGFTDGRYLYINSALASDEETKAEFKQYAVIDAYSLDDGKYAFSFTVPPLDGKLAVQFSIFGNKLFALYLNSLASYQLRWN